MVNLVFQHIAGNQITNNHGDWHTKRSDCWSAKTDHQSKDPEAEATDNKGSESYYKTGDECRKPYEQKDIWRYCLHISGVNDKQDYHSY